MEAKTRIEARTGIENIACTPENDILEDFYEGLMDGIIPQVELTIVACLRDLSDKTITMSSLQTETYKVTGNRIGRGVRIDIEYLD